MTSKLALLTGGSTGIGRHLAGALAAEGFSVAFSYKHSHAQAESLRTELEAAGTRVFVQESDVGIKQDVERFFADATRWHGDARIC